MIESFKSRMDQMEKSISDLEDKTSEITRSDKIKRKAQRIFFQVDLVRW